MLVYRWQDESLAMLKAEGIRWLLMARETVASEES